MQGGAEQNRTSRYVRLFALFLFLNCIFYRDFSYLSIGGSIYITEIFIFVSILAILLRWCTASSYQDRTIGRPGLYCAIFILFGALLFAINNNSDYLFSLREYASVYYSLFFIFTLVIAPSFAASNLLHSSIIVAAAISLLFVVARFLLGMGNTTTTDGVYRYGNSEFVGIMILYSYSLAMYLSGQRRSWINLCIVFLSAIVVNILIAHRSGSIGMAVATFMILYAFRERKNAFNKSTILAFGALCALMIGSIVLPEIIASALSRIEGTFSKDLISQDANASWRTLAWQHALSHMSGMDYFYGVGWGFSLETFNFNGRWYAGDGFMGMHNSLVYYFLHMGAIGIFLFILILLSSYKKALKYWRNNKNSKNGILVFSLLAGNVSILIFALFNVVLEGPYMSVVFWVTLGLLYNLSSLKNPPRISHIHHEKNSLSRTIATTGTWRINGEQSYSEQPHR